MATFVLTICSRLHKNKCTYNLLTCDRKFIHTEYDNDCYKNNVLLDRYGITDLIDSKIKR